MREYELTVIFHPDLEMNIDPALDKVKKLVETSGGKIIKEETEPKKRLSYPLKGQDFGIYYYFTVSLPPEAPSKIDSTLTITDEVLRHLIVRPEAKRAKLEARRKAQEEKRAKHAAMNAETINEKEGEE